MVLSIESVEDVFEFGVAVESAATHPSFFNRISIGSNAFSFNFQFSISQVFTGSGAQSPPLPRAALLETYRSTGNVAILSGALHIFMESISRQYVERT
jgi:hypothetical protein